MSHQSESPLSSSVFVLEPKTALIDEPVNIQLCGLIPDQKIRIRATTYDDRGQMWASWALFRADHTGSVDMRSQLPEDGTYGALDAMGLFWSMYPTIERQEVIPFTRTSLQPVQVSSPQNFSHIDNLLKTGSGIVLIISMMGRQNHGR